VVNLGVKGMVKRIEFWVSYFRIQIEVKKKCWQKKRNNLKNRDKED
jgi:hypothetical protein